MLDYWVQLEVLGDAAKKNKTTRQFQTTVNARFNYVIKPWLRGQWFTRWRSN